jgi:hypothetical protein
MVSAQIINVVQIKERNPRNSSSGNISWSTQTKRRLMSKLESPSVRIRIGKVTRLRIGFSIAFIIPRTSPAIKRSCVEPLNSTLGIKRMASHNPAIAATICKRSPWIISYTLPLFAKQVNLSEFAVVLDGEAVGFVTDVKDEV